MKNIKPSFSFRCSFSSFDVVPKWAYVFKPTKAKILEGRAYQVVNWNVINFEVLLRSKILRPHRG